MTLSRRLRRTPFYDGVEAAGVRAYTVYNHLLPPTVFRSIEEDNRHQKSAVPIWDVSCEWQVELRGPDAGRLMQMLTPRDLRGMTAGQCYYLSIVDETGGMLNDPDVSPLAFQGPKAEDLMARVFGNWVRDIRFFRCGWFDFQGQSLAIARSGYSNLIERIESGLLSYGNDMTDDNTPHECGLGRFCNTHTTIGCLGRDAVLRGTKEGPIQQIRAIEIHDDVVSPCDRHWPLMAGEYQIGRVSSAAWSTDCATNVAIGMIRMTHWTSGTKLDVITPTGNQPATVHETFWN